MALTLLAFSIGAVAIMVVLALCLVVLLDRRPLSDRMEVGE